ncbi:MAG: prepilin-type N-terminal cleavage/methylation domain-containing protein [Deltaproteobacteria bacterium]|nr:prepilin-type N-terminal cleavage/methylation domain-containing protein [Deltaproteobacteria bacterium]
MLKRINELKRNSGGFQLVELLIVIALISILLAIGVPSIVGQLGHLRLSRSTRDMATELNAARLRAIAQNTNYRVSFTVPGSYLLQRWDKTTSTWVNESTHTTMTVEAGTGIISPGAGFSTVFSPNGTARDGGGGVPNSICINNSAGTNDRMKITVEGPTGMIKVLTGC